MASGEKSAGRYNGMEDKCVIGREAESDSASEAEEASYINETSRGSDAVGVLVDGSVTGAVVSGCVSGVVAGVSGCVTEVVAGCVSDMVVGVAGCVREVAVDKAETSPHPVQVHWMSIFDCTACLYSSWEMPV